MKYSYTTQGTCSRRISYSIRDGLIHDVEFVGGCPGNLQGISALVEGKPAEEIISLLSGIRCGSKETSCPDQFARALSEGVVKMEEEKGVAV